MDTIVNVSAEDKNLIITKTTSHCNYTLGFTKTYGYSGQISITNHFNIPICDKENDIIINYIDKTKDEDK